MLILQLIFWICVVAVFHSYVLFPLILKLLCPKGNQTKYENDDEPIVSIVMSAYNEEAVIEDKINSIFKSNYPKEKIEVIIGSDCSSDNTNEIMTRLAEADSRIYFKAFDKRQGKANIINQLVNKAKGEILILSDANVMFDENTIAELIKPFSDQSIGVVDTNMINTNLKQDGISIQEKSYISREVIIKNREGCLWGSMMGPFGGCYAIRKKLYKPVPSNLLVDDFYICMMAIKQGFKAINNLEAKVYEDVSNDLGIEFRRKIRIATGNFQNLKIFSSLLVSKSRGVAFSFISHKVLRWIGPIFLILAMAVLIPLAINSTFYLILLAFYLFSFLLPIIDMILKRYELHNTIIRFFTHFYTMNLALLAGLFKAIKGVETNVWKPTQRFQ
ncbi:MAG: glycosyltransferase [Bacteroidales bacterium]|nr:glycosyltransferase [Bacteroidales bacterium]